MTVFIQADHYPELAENGGAYVLAENLGLNGAELNDTVLRRAMLADLEPVQIVSSVMKLNAVLKNEDPATFQFEDGQLPSAETPPLEDKEPLMQAAAQAFKSILGDASLDDSRALRRAGLTLAGAINFIHPALNGNGRTARLTQYFVEFGAERGEKLFEAEAYSAIGRLAVFDVDFRKSVDTEPQVDMEHALNAYCNEKYPEWDLTEPRSKASLRVCAFLDAMTGAAEIVTTEDSLVSAIDDGKFASLGTFEDRDEGRRKVGQTYSFIKMPAGTLIRDIYEAQYRAMSFAATIDPELVTDDIRRVGAERVGKGFVTISADIIE